MTSPKPASALRPLLIVALVVVLAAVGYYVYSEQMRAARPAQPVLTQPGPLVAPAEPQYPVPPLVAEATPALPPLPALPASDADLLTALAALFNDDSLLAMLVREHLIERFVASVDNLPNRRITANILPLRPLAGKLLVLEAEGKTILSAQNSARYRGPVNALTTLDQAAVVHLYRRWYPLFQQAYRELGYPDGYFNDRLIVVIDHLLAAPEPDSAIELLPVNGRFQFANPAFESASVGHKLMLRLGADSATRLKAWLGGLKTLLVALPAAAPDALEESPIP